MKNGKTPDFKFPDVSGLSEAISKAAKVPHIPMREQIEFITPEINTPKWYENIPWWSIGLTILGAILGALLTIN